MTTSPQPSSPEAGQAPHTESTKSLLYRADCVEQLERFDVKHLSEIKLPSVAADLRRWLDRLPDEDIALDNQDVIERVETVIALLSPES